MPRENPPVRWFAADSRPTSASTSSTRGGGDAAGGGSGPEVVAGGVAGVHAAGVEDGADEAGRLAEVGVADAAVADVAVVGAGEPDHHPHGGGLAGAVGADEAGDPAGGHGEAEVVDGDAVAVGLGEGVDGDHEVAPGALGCGWPVGRSVSAVGAELGERAQADAEVSQLLEDAMECGLVDDGPGDDGGSVVLVGEGQAVEPGRPATSEVPVHADLVVRDGRVISESVARSIARGALVGVHEGERTNEPGERTSHDVVIVRAPPGD